MAAPATTRFGGLPRPFWYLWVGTLLNRMGSFVGPFLALYLTRARGFGVAEAGLVLTCFGAGSAGSQPLGGTLADHFGRRRTLIGGLLASSVGILAVGAAHRLPLLCLAVFGYGLCLDLFRPAAQAATADLIAPADRVRAFALVFWAVNLGFAVASPIGGLLAQHSYGLLFALDAATTLAYAVLVARGVPETRPQRSPGTPRGSLSDVLRDRIMALLILATLLQAVVYLQVFSTLPLVFGRHHLGPGSYGLAISVNGLVIVVAQPLLLRHLARQPRARLLLSAAVLLGAGFGLTAFVHDLRGFIVTIVVWTSGEVLGAGLLSALVAGLAPPHLRGRYLGTYGAAFGVAAMLAPLLGTQVLSRFGEPTLWGGAALLCLVSGGLLVPVSRAAERRAARSATPAPPARPADGTAREAPPLAR